MPNPDVDQKDSKSRSQFMQQVAKDFHTTPRSSSQQTMTG